MKSFYESSHVDSVEKMNSVIFIVFHTIKSPLGIRKLHP